MDRVKGKVAIVTGAAGGIGKATALLLAEEGARVVVADIDQAGGEKTAREIIAAGGQAVFSSLDVSRESNWARTVDQTIELFGRLDILVNNAGIMMVSKIEDMSLTDWRRLMSVNLDGVFLGTKYAIRAMKKNGGGSIINLSSAAGIVGTLDDTSAYCASKGAVRLFTKAAALECSHAGHDYNIRVNSIHPGATETPMTAAMLEDRAMRDKLMDVLPIGFIGKPADIARAILFLASDESRFMTGAEMVVDGGWTAK